MLSNITLVSIALPSLETNINFAKENGVSSIKHVFTSAKAQKHKKRRGERICHFVLTKQNKKRKEIDYKWSYNTEICHGNKTVELLSGL